MKFGIVTPSFNSRVFIRHTLDSVIAQAGPFEIDYLLVDGGSTDGTLDLLREYEARLATGELKFACASGRLRWTSGRDNGMYDAIGKGLEAVEGDVQAWINADDVYFPGAFDAVRRIFERHPEVEWLKGVTSYIDERSRVYEDGRCWVYHRPWIARGVYGRELHFIQQDSCFWRSELYRRSGGMNRSVRLAGDYDLWVKFGRTARLWSMNRAVSAFRKREGQLSRDMTAYFAECDRISPRPVNAVPGLRLYERLSRTLPRPLARVLLSVLFRPRIEAFQWRAGEPVLFDASAFWHSGLPLDDKAA